MRNLEQKFQLGVPVDDLGVVVGVGVKRPLPPPAPRPLDSVRNFDQKWRIWSNKCSEISLKLTFERMFLASLSFRFELVSISDSCLEKGDK